MWCFADWEGDDEANVTRQNKAVVLSIGHDVLRAMTGNTGINAMRVGQGRWWVCRLDAMLI